MILAPGVSFDADRHEYWYKGKQLSGVTGLIAKKLALKMPQEILVEHQEEGIHVHRAAQKWIETGDSESVHPGVKWLTETFWTECYGAWDGSDPPNFWKANSEVLVSDFQKYASAVDIVVENGPGSGFFDIYDIKKGSMNREYVTWQLSIYKYFIEKHAEKQVRKCICICIKDREYYTIFPKPFEQVEKLLYGDGA
jgi:hypothetical protein